MRTPLPITGPELRRYRRSKGVSMKELARRAGWSKSYLSLIENDHRPLTDTVRLSCLSTLGADLSLDQPADKE